MNVNLPMLGYLYLISLVFCAIMAFIYRKNLRGRGLTILLPFLFLTSVQEIILDFNDRYFFIKSTSAIYNIYRPVSAIVFLVIYFNVPFMRSLKKLIAGLGLTYLLAVLITHCFINRSININNSYLTIARGFVITFCAVLFLFRYFNLDNLKEEKYWRPLVWITAGVAIFYPVVTTSVAFQNYLSDLDATLLGYKLYHLIPQVLSIFMYSCFSYAFYLCQKIK